MSAQVFLTIETRRKGIPYPPVSNPDSQGFGFKPLKGKPDRIDKVHEARDLPGIIDLLQAINSRDTPFFSVGCEKHIGPIANGTSYVRGYVEFAYNFAAMVEEIQYLTLFKAFNDYIHAMPMPEAWSVNWDLQPAHFKAVAADGYTCSMWLLVQGYFTQAEAVQNYNDLGRHLVGFFDRLSPVETDGMKPIY